MSAPDDHDPDRDAEWLLGELVAARVFDPERADALRTEFLAGDPSDVSAPALADHLVGRGHLTRYQVEFLLNGDAGQLVVGPFLLLQPVSRSSWGTLYVAQSRADRRRYAVRVLPPRHLWKVREATAQLASLAALPPYPAVVPFAAVDSADGCHYLSWPFFDGETLAHSVQRVGPLSPPDAARLFADLADGLAVCHAAGVIHGLVQPSTILLGSDRRPRLLDLGLGALLAENLSDEQLLDTVGSVGATDTLDYTAPETLTAPPARTPAADVYSLGCSLYFALTGFPPFPDSSAVRKALGHQSEDPVPIRNRNPNVPAALTTVVERMMRKSPAERPTDLFELCRELRRAVDLPADSFAEDSSTPCPITAAATEGSAGESPESFVIKKRSEWSDHVGAIDFDDFGPPPSRGAVAPISPPGEDSEIDAGVGAPPVAAATPHPVPAPAPSSVRSIRLSAPAVPQKAAEPAAVGVPDSKQLRSIPAPVNIESGQTSAKPDLVRPPVVVPDPPLFARKTIRTARSVLFWKKPLDAVQLSVFGPPQIAPGQKAQFLVYAHLPEAFDGVSTLCRALHTGTDLLGAGYIDRPVPRGAEVGLHMALANAGVAKSLITFPWTGQTLPRTFEVFVQWESPTGLTSGVISAGINNDRVGVVPLHFVVLPRTS